MKRPHFKFYFLLQALGWMVISPFLLEAQDDSSQPPILGTTETIVTQFEQSTALGISPQGHVFGSASNRQSRHPTAFSYDGKTTKQIPPLPEYHEFHALDASDNGLVVGYSFVKKTGATSPIALPTIFDHKSEVTRGIGNKMGRATGISASGKRIVGNIKGHPVIWQLSSDGKWISTSLLGPSEESVAVNHVSISPNGKIIAASARFGNRGSRSLEWKRGNDHSWSCVEYSTGSEVFLATRQVNDKGWRIGTYTRANNQNVAAILIPGQKLISIGGHDEEAQSYGYDIDNHGRALVYFYHQDKQVSFLYKDKKRTQIWDSATGDCASMIATGISDRLMIVGSDDSDSPEKYVAVFWRPTR